MIKTYRKKPVDIEAVQFTKDNYSEVWQFTNGMAHTFVIDLRPEGKDTCIIPTLEGQHIATEGDYIIRGVEGEFYPCKSSIFEKTYEQSYKTSEPIKQ
jgi:hypothetical protein